MPASTAAPFLTLDFEHKGTTTIVKCHGRLVSGVNEGLYANVSKFIPGVEEDHSPI